MSSITRYPTAKGKAWRVQYYSPDGRKRSKQGFKTKTEAQAWADKNAVAIHDGEWLNPQAGTTTVAELWPTWFTSQHHLANSSKLSLESAWRTHLNQQWGTRGIGTIRAPEVQQWVNDMVAAGKSASVVQRCFNLLSNLCAMGVRDDLVRRNPCQGVRLPPKTARKTVTLTRPQVELLISKTKRYASLVTFLAYTGARWGEAVALTVADVDLDAGRATINKAAPTIKGKATVGPTKTRQTRVIALPAVVVEALRSEIRGKLPTALVWTNQTGGYVTTPSRRSWWHSAVDACRETDVSFPDVTPHDLRHAAASMLISAGASVLVVQRQLGHASAKMTLDRYSHLFESDLDAVVDAFSDRAGLERETGNFTG